MSGAIFPWQADAWARMAAMRERMPHAVLLHGPQGIGKTAFAERLAQALLCEAPLQDGQPCDACAACGWFAQYAHPDYRRVRPEALEEGDAGEEGEADKAEKGGKTSKTPSREIRIEQIRALSDFMNVSTHRSGRRVVLLYPAEALNTVSANSLLKTLEEPPPGTVFLLVSHRPDRLLPTILSRCRQIALTMPPRDAAERWLAEQGVDDGTTWLAEAGGAPLAALDAAQGGSREGIDALLAHLARPEAESPLRVADRLQKIAPVELVATLQRWLYDLFSVKFSGSVRYYPKYRSQLEALAARAGADRLLAAQKSAAERRAIAEHPLSAKLFIEDMLLDYSSLFA
ncbi:DNA polymerase III subunit delta' [Noviherbaspirillum pedocola]|uniref:DNA polymerase III subunit delta n=1 Tax=Noviherbaspirillum pedocola TaxID=2801341 RepID=A0A934SU21_9BURK|nr:DNA polymerase III subunit delta' [Noviherbaspirillum pedocola]MBK4735712.1 DNA polymerase III subunit delta' [Noviherbaspirillum pedocola]